MKTITYKSDLLGQLENIDKYCKKNQVIVAIDAEWDTSDTRGYDDVHDVRHYRHIISIQVVIKAKDCAPYECILMRDPDDRYFYFDDLFKIIRWYFDQNNIPLSKVTNKNSRFDSPDDTVKAYRFVLTGFYMGVDISVFKDWYKVFDSPTRKDILVNQRQQAIASTSDVAVSVNTRSKNSKKKGQTGKYAKNYALMTVRDTILLAPPKANLDAVGQMVNYPKLDTESWDHDGYQHDGCYTFYPTGYYKSHMRTLLHDRYDDYLAYAMTDSEIVMLYVDQWFGVLDTLDMLSDKARQDLPFASGSLSAKVAHVYAVKPNVRLAQRIHYHLHYDNTFNKRMQRSLQQCVKTNRFGEPVYEITEKTSPQDLIDYLDWDMMRKGYYQPLAEDDTDAKHRSGQTDISSVEATRANADAFNIANKAYFGGHNVAYTHGLIEGANNHRKFIDIDAKSAYNTGGHLMPDFSTAADIFHKPNVHINDDVIKQLQNGVWTVGCGVCEIKYDTSKQHYNYDQKFVFTPYRSSEGDTPRYVQSAGDYTENTKRQACFMTLTDMINAYENGADVYCDDLYMPVQDTLVCDNHYMDRVYPTGVAQDLFAKMRAQYPKSNPYNGLYKMLGNSVYGKTGQGLHKATKRSYLDNMQYYLPLSVVSNPFVAAQYTAITRYVVMRLIKVAEKVEPSLKVESITTDGFLSSVDDNVDIDAFEKKFQRALLDEDPRWVYVAHTYFDDEFYEIKGCTPADLFDVRTRFQVTEDGDIDALAGIKGKKPSDVFNTLKHGALIIPMTERRMSSLTDEKHSATQKHLLSTDTMEVTGFLNYDFTRKLSVFHPGKCGYGYWDTVPFDNVDELAEYRRHALFLSRNWCIYDNNNAKLFKACIDQLMAYKKDTSYRIKDADTINESESYQQTHLLRYCVKFMPDVDRKMLYDRYFSSGKYSSYTNFRRAWNRCKNQIDSLFINYLAISELMPLDLN